MGVTAAVTVSRTPGFGFSRNHHSESYERWPWRTLQGKTSTMDQFFLLIVHIMLKDEVQSILSRLECSREMR